MLHCRLWASQGTVWAKLYDPFTVLFPSRQVPCGGCLHYIGVGRCFDLGGGGDIFFNNRNVIFFPVSEQCLQYYNTAMKFIM